MIKYKLFNNQNRLWSVRSNGYEWDHSDLNASYGITYFVCGTGPPRAFKYYVISRVAYTRINTVAYTAYATMCSESNRTIVD